VGLCRFSLLLVSPPHATRLKQNATLFDYMIHMAALSARHMPPTCPGPPVGPGCGLTDTERHERHIYVHTLYMP
jgi:hypothetical protein